MEALLADSLDTIDDLHGSNGLDHKIPIVLGRRQTLLLEIEGTVDRHFLTMSASVSLGPLQSPRIVLHLEMLVTLRPAESESLAVVTHEHDAMPRVNAAGTEPTFFNSHWK